MVKGAMNTVTVPGVVGLPQPDAQAAITAANLLIGAITWENSDTAPAGAVVSQAPPAGASVEEGSSVDLVLSLGPSAPQLSLLDIFPPRLTLTAQGETHQLSVTGIYSDGARKNLTSSAQGTTYAPGDANILNITPDGLVSALNNGTTTVTVSNGASSTQIPVAVDIRIAPPPDPTAYLSGRVLDAKTNQPVVDAGIEEASLGAIVNTDAAGKFVYSVPQGGSYRFYISKPGYVTAKQEIVVDSGQNRSMNDISLTPYETFTTQITAAEGGTATNAEGTTEMIFPPGALPSDIALSITRFPDEKAHPVGVPKGQVFVDSIQFFPEHIDFNQEVTVRLSNKWGFSPGTPIPFAFGSHDEHDPFPELSYFDPGMGQVTADGQWIELKTSHFSCPTMVLPSCGGGTEGAPVPNEGEARPNTEPPRQPDGPKGADDGCEKKYGASTVYNSIGVLEVNHQITPYQSLGAPLLSLLYRSDTSNTGRILDIPVENDEATVKIPEQMTFKVEVEGVRKETHFKGAAGNLAMGYYFEGKNAQGETLKTGAYRIDFALSNDYRKYFYTAETFGGPPVRSTGVPLPDLVSYTEFAQRNLIINNQIDSPFGAGWSLSELDRLYPDPYDPSSALLIRGGGSPIYYTKSGDRSVRETLAQGLSYPTGLVVDSRGDLLAADRDHDRVVRIAPSGAVTVEANVIQANGLAIAPNDDLYIASKTTGEIYKREASTGTLSLYVTLPQVTSQSVQDLEIDSQGNLYAYDTGGDHYLYQIDPDKRIIVLMEGSTKLLVSSMALDPEDNLYLTYNNEGFVDCGGSFVSKYSSQGIFATYDRLNSPAGITFDREGTMYLVDRECGEQEYRIYTIDKFGSKKLFNDTAIGTDPNIALAQLTHDIAWSPNGIAVTASLENNIYRLVAAPLTPPKGEYSTLTRNEDGSFTRTLKYGTKIEFDRDGLQTSKRDRNGNTTTYSYDGNGKLLTITDPTGKKTTLNYNDGRLQSLTDPVGRTTVFQHDAAGNLVSIKDPDQAETTYSYNSDHLLTSKTVPTGKTYIYEYDRYNRIIKSVSPNGEIRQYQSGKMRAVVNDLPADVGTKENPANPTQISALKNAFTDAEGNKSTTKVNLRGFVLEETDPIGRVTATERDSSQNPTKITWPNGEVETLTYDRNGNLLTHTSASTGGTTTYTYDPVFHQVTGITDPKGHTTTMEYDARGNLIKITDPQNHQGTMEYDARGLVTRITDALGHVTTNAYDSSGNLLSTTDPLGHTTAFTVDASGKLVSATDPEGKTTSFRYDLANNPVETTAADGTQTSFTYARGERCFACGAANGADLLTALSDANRQTTSFTYNEIGQLTQTINPAGLITAYQYDADRKLIGKTDPKGQTTAYLYDPAGQLIQKNLPDDQVQYFYDTMGNVSTVMDSTSRVILAYDGQNRLIQSEIGFDPSLPITIHQNTTVEAGNKLYDFRDITVDGAVLTLSGSHTFTHLNVINGATVTHKGATTTTTSSLALEVTHTLTIDATSRIDVSDKGYLGGWRGDNSGYYGRTVGNTTTGGVMVLVEEVMVGWGGNIMTMP